MHEKPPKHLWLLLDRSNGDELSHYYTWFFTTRERARQHKKAQHANPKYARLSGPFKYVLEME